MNKYVYYNGKDVKLGDTGQVTNGEQTVNFTVSLRNIPELLRMGIIKEVDKELEKKVVKKVKEIPVLSIATQISDRIEQTNMNINHYVKILANKMSTHGISTKSANESLIALYAINKAGFFSLILKEIALAMDEHYEGHISTSKEMFAISAEDGKPCQIIQTDPTLYHSISLFRNNVDAIVASKILSTLRKEVFKGNGRRK